MMTTQLRKRLMQQMDQEPDVRQWLVLSKCGAGLAIVALIAFIGISAEERRDDIAQVAEAARPMPTPDAHRREVFEQRRITFERTQRGRLARQQLPAQSSGFGPLE